MNRLKHYLHYFLVPSERNNYRGKALHLDMLSVYLAFALVLTIVSTYVAPVSSNILGVATDITIEKLYELTNNERTKNGLSTLSYNETLAQASQKKAADMFGKNYWAHYAPDGATPWDFMHAAGYKYEFAGENLAKNFLFSQAVVEAWMNSPTHRENILRKDYTEVGYAVVNGVLNGEETTLVVQMFGKPLSSAPLAAPVRAEEQQESAIPSPAVSLSVSPPAGSSAIVQDSKVNAASTQKAATLFNIYNIDLIFFAFIFAAIVLDLYIVTKMKIVRIGSKPLAHLIFLGFILFGIFVIAVKGSIL